MGRGAALIVGLVALMSVAVTPPAEGSLSASVDFSVSGGNLIVTLTNTSTDDVLVPTDVLTAVFFDVAGVGALSPVSAILSGGSQAFYDPDGQPAGGDVGGEWAYASGLVGAPLGATEGISSTGLGLFGGPNFGSSNLAGPAAVNGLQYGLLSAGDDPGTGNGGITGSGGLVNNQVTFTLSGLPSGFTLDSSISNVFFQYGTSLDENKVPVPATITLVGLGLLGAAAIGRLRSLRRRK